MRRIGVGIIGLGAHGGWASRAHLPALRALADRFVLTGLCGSTPATARLAADRHGVSFHTSDPAALAGHPDVDLVVIAVKVPDHAALLRATIATGKPVYCEWPLARDEKEAVAIAEMAQAHDTSIFIGLQGRAGPAVRGVRALIRGGRIGRVLAMNVLASVGAPWNGLTDSRRTYLNDRASGATMLSIPVGHFLDALIWAMGDFAALSGTMAIRRNNVLVVDSGATIPTDVSDQIVLAGTVETGATAAIHYRGGLSAAGNFRWEINGEDGDMLITGGDGHFQYGFASLAISERGAPLAAVAYSEPFTDHWQAVASTYAAVHADLVSGTSTAPALSDALRLHGLLERLGSH